MALPPPPPMPAAPPSPSCFRHPNRPAWRSCTRCGRVACNDCLVQASVGSQCVECVKAGQPTAKVRLQRSIATKSYLVTYTLMAINIAVFVAMVAATRSGLSGEATSWHKQGALLLGPVFDADTNTIVEGLPHEPWRLVTSGFLHFGIIHLLFNMYALYNLGPQLEAMVGRLRLAALYLASMFAGGFAMLLVSPHALGAGASGAIFGLFGAYAAAMWQRRINPLQTSLGTVLLINLLLGLTVSNISLAAHVGGLIGGALCAAPWFPRANWRLPKWLVPAAPLIVGGVAVAGSMLLR